MSEVTDHLAIRLSRSDDLLRVCELLVSSKLPTEGVSDHLPSFFVAEENGTIVGAMGLEIYGSTGLLRSAAVDSGRRNGGIGSKLYVATVRHAREMGLTSLVLLTETAERFFRKRGFQRIERTTISGPVTRSAEFTGACPTSAVCMEMKL